MRNTFLTHNRPMARKSRIGATVLSILLIQAVMPFSALAQTVDSATNPSAVVPAVSYRSVFRETSLGVEKETNDWRKANQEVGQFLRGHVDILKWEEQESAKAIKESGNKSLKEPTGQPVVAPSRPDATKTTDAPAHKH